MQWNRLVVALTLLLWVGPASGCYLGHLARGQVALLWARQPIAELLEAPATPTPLRESLAGISRVRDYAARLGLEVGERYTAFAPWPGEFVVVAVVATRPGEVEPLTRWYPIVGRVPYRGYFDRALAADHAAALRERGLDVCEVPVRAYSTLGWFDDPVTGPMLRQPEPELVETLFHELVHATVFVAGDAEFNEGVASFVGQEARVVFYGDSEGPEAAARERRAVSRDRRIRSEILALRSAVEQLYEHTTPGPVRAAERSVLEAQARLRIAGRVPAASAGDPFAERLRLNDACLALSGTYHADTPHLARRLESLGGDLGAFIALIRRVAEDDRPREALLGAGSP